MTTATKPQQYQGWEGFAPGPWTEGINVRDFIQRNYTPYDGDSAFLEGATARTTGIWQTVWLEGVPETSIRGLRIAPQLSAAAFGID